jgi:thermitase
MKKTFITVNIFACALMLLALTFPFNRATAQKGRNLHVAPVRPAVEPFVPGRVLVKFRSSIGLDHARQIVAALGARDADELPQIGVFVLDLPEQADEEAFANALQQRPDVEFAELDRIVKPAEVVPNDPWYAGAEWHLPKIAAPAAWPITTGNSGITIAILDSGVDINHQDLSANIVPGWNIVSNNGDMGDVNGHGTNVAGAAAALSNNGIGVASLCWTCKIMPVRISDSTGSSTYSAISSGLNWAADHGARVANISFIVSESSAVKTAAQYFQSKGGVVTASAGNYSTFTSAADNPYILTVSATDISDAPSGFSNYGNNVDVAAPEAVYTTVRGGGYMYAGGTSFSAPIVAGVAALVFSVNPSLTPIEVQDILRRSADDLGPAGFDVHYGWGRVNAARAVAMAGTAAPDQTAPTASFVTPTAGATVFGNAGITVSASDNAGVSSVLLRIDGIDQAIDTTAPYNFSWNTVAVTNGLHTLTCVAADAAGNQSVSSITVVVNNLIDATPPTIAILQPSINAVVSGTVSVLVEANDNGGKVSRVDFYVDNRLTASSTTAPYTMKWNTRKISAGMHVLRCKAYDSAGNLGSSNEVTVFK